MESFEFEIPFDEARERKATADQLKHMWKRNVTIAYFAFGISAFFLLLTLLKYGSLRVNGELTVGPFFIAFFGIYLFLLYFRSKKLTNERLQKIINVLKTKGQTTTFINDTNFGFSGGFGDCALTWNAFTSIDHWDGYLLIRHYGKGSTSIVVSVDEIGPENFNRVLSGVQTKIESIKNEVH